VALGLKFAGGAVKLCRQKKGEKARNISNTDIAKSPTLTSIAPSFQLDLPRIVAAQLLKQY